MHPSREIDKRVSIGGLLLLSVWVVVYVCLFIATLVSDGLDIGLYGVAACLIVTLPALQRGYDWVSPWSLIMLAFYVGCGARSLAITSLGWDDPLVQKYYLLGRDVAEYQGPALLFLLGVALLTCGWMVAGNWTAGRALETGNRRVLVGVNEYMFGRFFWLVVVGCALVGFAGFFGYASATGGLDLTYLSAKRTSYYVDDQADYQGAAGVWQTVNDLSTVAFLLAFAKFTMVGKPTSLAQRVFLLALFVNAAILPFYSSVRSEVMYLVLTALAIYVCLRGRIHHRYVWLSGGVALLLLAFLTVLRQRSEGKLGGFSSDELVRGISDAMLLNQNFVEIPKSVNLILAVPNELPYSYGASMTNYLFAAIPRSMWADKPIIDAGVDLGVVVYGTDGSSIPPGAIAEFYWMFGPAALLLGSLLLGVLLRRFYGWSRPRRGDVRGALMYGVAIFDLGGNAISGSVGYAAYSAVMAGVTMAVMLRFAGGRPAQPKTEGESTVVTSVLPARRENHPHQSAVCREGASLHLRK